jgi:hypothetical protein
MDEIRSGSNRWSAGLETACPASAKSAQHRSRQKDQPKKRHHATMPGPAQRWRLQVLVEAQLAASRCQGRVAGSTEQRQMWSSVGWWLEAAPEVRADSVPPPLILVQLLPQPSAVPSVSTPETRCSRLWASRTLRTCSTQANAAACREAYDRRRYALS